MMSCCSSVCTGNVWYYNDEPISERKTFSVLLTQVFRIQRISCKNRRSEIANLALAAAVYIIFSSNIRVRISRLPGFAPAKETALIEINASWRTDERSIKKIYLAKEIFVLLIELHFELLMFVLTSFRCKFVAPLVLFRRPGRWKVTLIDWFIAVWSSIFRSRRNLCESRERIFKKYYSEAIQPRNISRNSDFFFQLDKEFHFSIQQRIHSLSTKTFEFRYHSNRFQLTFRGTMKANVTGE